VSPGRSPLSPNRNRRRHPHAGVFCFLLATILAGQSAVSAGQDSDVDGHTIVSIIFERYSIFDTSNPKTSKWPYRWANALHITSRENFLRSMLLFREGDIYTAAVAAESARLLRSLGIMNPVEITAREVEGGVEVVVETHDQWSLQVGADAGLSGNRGRFGFQLQEENLLGWGKYVNIGYDTDIERDTWSFRYQDPNLFRTRWVAEIGYQNRTDGYFKDIRLGRPFFSLETPRAWGGRWESEEITEYLYAANESAVQGRRNSEVLRGWYGLKLGSGVRTTRRVFAGWDAQRVTYDDWQWVDTGNLYPTPQDLEISGPRIGYEQIADNYEVLSGFRSWSSQEDVGLGPSFRVGATISGPAVGGDINRVLFDGVFDIARHRGRWLLVGDAWFSGRLDRSEWQNILVGAQFAASQIGERGFQFRLLADTSYRLALDRQLTLGSEIGLRGWDPDYFDGTGRVLVNAQWRTIMFREVLHLFSVGAVIFADAGKTWGARVGHDTGGVRVDAGVGLLFDLSRFSTNNVLRLEIAWPDDGGPYVLSISGGALF
jgi:hypothetical protein